jgi:hypothetical protein
MAIMSKLTPWPENDEAKPGAQMALDKTLNRNHGRRESIAAKAGLGAIVLLSAIGIIAMRAASMAAPINIAPTWGKVLIAGGADDVDAVSSTELYDPSSNTFAASGDTPVMNEARFFPSIAVLQSGKVLIAGGGTDEVCCLNSTEIYDPSSNSFAPAFDTPVMNTARSEATATLLPSGKVLIAGGYGEGNNIPLSSAELYDPATNTFSSAGFMNVSRAEGTATLLPSGKVLIAGGATLQDQVLVPLLSTEIYDPGTNSFAAERNTPIMNVARDEATATLLASGKVLIAGGNVTGMEATSTELYDPITNTFAPADQTANMNVGRAIAQATLLLSGKVLIAGGVNHSALASTELYDPATNSFAPPGDTATMNLARYQMTSTLLPSGRVLIAGGGGDVDNFSSTELYDPATNTFAGPGDTATMNDTIVFAAAVLLQSPSPSPTATTTATPASTATPIATATATSIATATSTATPTATATATGGPTRTATDTPTATIGKTPTPAATATQRRTPTTTSTAIATATPSQTATPSPTATPSAPVTLLPSAFDFGIVRVFQSSDAETVTLTNGDGKLVIRGWSIGPDFKVVSSTCPSPTGQLRRGNSCDFVIAFQPQSTGLKNELFRVFDSVRNSPQKVKLHGFATRH